MDNDRMQRMTEPFALQKIQQPVHDAGGKCSPLNVRSATKTRGSNFPTLALLKSTDYGDCPGIGVTSGFLLVGLAHAPRCFSRAALSRSSNRSISPLPFPSLGKLGATPFVRA